ncbi:MAG: flavodoxin family protein [bacterium]
MRKVVAFLGSPRKEGNTAIILQKVLEGVRKSGTETETVFLHEMDIQGCQECFVCQSILDEPGCGLLDDTLDLFPKIIEADLVIFASPVFC